ncbi:hypothetical protein QOZ88_06760 [Blastococcus sp. BMG 814]|uniref:DUF4760 domain-containing protein n=1 Tax=Blastococcus carthaginiensis TaxID=3050034 RepID=A0ABT9IAY9_9ACTN|nr:hypothetical protein [Blastococcus carthaginiensis]MDP5182334.1 hypothetical protein [Blastococcus carthaginiensis]
MNWSTAVATSVAVSGAVVAIVGSMFTFLSNRRGQYDNVLIETAKLTSGDTARARHVIGSVLEAHHAPAHGGPVPLSNEAMQAYFDVLWTFERLYALHTSLRPLVLRSRLSGPQRLLLLSINGSIVTWLDYEKRVGDSVRSHASSEGLRRLGRELARLGQQTR